LKKYCKPAALLLLSCLALEGLMPALVSSAPADEIIRKAPKDTPKVPGLVISEDDPLPSVTARSAIVMEARTHQVIYERDAHAARFPASTTKIMTLIVALEKGNLDDVVTVSSHASGTEGSTIWLEPGDQMTLRELLYGMMLRSGNDATVAVAEHIAGSVDAFAALMTQKAHEIGAVDTNFENANGLPSDNHYTTAYDLALITAYGYSLPGFEEIVSTKEISFPWVKDDTHLLRNENQMLWLYEGGNGVKTGYTMDAGRCLVSGAKREGVQLVSVVLDSNWMWNDSILLLNYGFSHLAHVTLLHQGETVGEVKLRGSTRKKLPVCTAENVVMPVIEGKTRENFTTAAELPAMLPAPVAKGDVVGRLHIYEDGQEVDAVDLVAAQSAERRSFYGRIFQWLRDFVQKV
jgi:D-alanyl-D-alanine carboxypeptidase (penicillin-binding protein 5/6)